MPYKDYKNRLRRSKEYYASHRSERIAYAKKYGKRYEKTDKCKAARKAYYKLHRGEAWLKYSILKSTAKRYNRDFTLTKEEYAILVSQPCHYCGGDLPEAGGGLDRQDNRFGYVHGNVVPCCERCNEKKGRLEGVGLTYPRTVEILLEILRG